MSCLDGFTPFDFKEGTPRISITCNGITFNRSVAMKLHHPEFVKIMINYDKKQLLILQSSKDDHYSVPFHKHRKNNAVSVRMCSKSLRDAISDMMGWDLSNNAYSVDGRYIRDGSAVLFDLTEAKSM